MKWDEWIEKHFHYENSCSRFQACSDRDIRFEQHQYDKDKDLGYVDDKVYGYLPAGYTLLLPHIDSTFRTSHLVTEETAKAVYDIEQQITNLKAEMNLLLETEPDPPAPLPTE